MTDAELAILCIVAEGPIHGHAIQTIVERRGLRAWTNIGISSMYYVLEKLERQGLLASENPTSTEGPSRRKYRVTAAGMGVLQTAVSDLLSTPHETANDFELGLANLPALRTNQVRSAFTTYQHELVTRLEQARQQEQSLAESGAPFHVRAMFGHQIALLEAEIAWMQHFIVEWEAQAPPDAPPPEMPDAVEIPRMKQVILPHDPDSPHRAQTRPMKRPQADEPRPRSAGPLHETTINRPTPPASRPPTPPDDRAENESDA